MLELRQLEHVVSVDLSRMLKAQSQSPKLIILLHLNSILPVCVSCPFEIWIADWMLFS